MADTVNLTIDDRQVTVPAGTLVIDAARKAGIEIPVFCSHPRLDPVGVCRMCLVEFVGPRGSRLDISCTVPATEGMVVRTDTEQVKKARQGVLGFLLINHPLDCPICDKGGECPLQDQTLQYGPGASQFVEPKRRKAKQYPISDLIMLDQERCVLCWRCIRYLEEWEDKPQLGLFQRGDRSTIDFFPGQPVDAKTSGSIIDICPVGALTDRTARFHYRPWELTKTPSICTHCAVGCNLRLDERVHGLRRVVARENDAVNDTWICDKGRFLHNFVDDAEGRLKTPLIRKDGELRPATWAEALDKVAERFMAIAESKGPAALGGVASGRVSNEAAYLFQKFFRGLAGSNNVDFAGGSAVAALPSGLSSIADVRNSDLIVLVGLDPDEVAPVLDLHIKRAVRRGGAKVLIVNPRRIELAKYPGAFLPVRPGNQSIVLNGVASQLLARRESAAGQGGARRPAAGPGAPAATDEWSRVRAYTPERVTSETGFPPAALSLAADLLAGAKKPLFLYGAAAATGERGPATVAALQALAALLGQPDRVAYIPTSANSQGLRDMGLLPDTLPGQLPLADAAVRERLGRLWGAPVPAGAGLPYRQMVGGGVRGLYVMGGNPAAEPGVAEALKGLDFLVVQELYLNETAQLADVVLPASSWAEHDGTYTSFERRVQRGPAAITAVGESLADWQILTTLAGRWQAVTAPVADVAQEAAEPEWKRKRRRQARAQNGGPVAVKAWTYGSAAAVLEEIGKAVAAYAGLRWETLGLAGVQYAASRQARRSDLADVAAVPVVAQGQYWLDAAPLLFDAGPLMQHSHERLKQRIPQPFVALNPADLGIAGLAEGSRVQVTSPQGKISLIVRSDAAVQPGTAWVPLGLAGAPGEVLGAGSGQPVAVSIVASEL
ncbi:MAG TPA: NADH-quinone oxidoreductase subunit NuoG [Anaerolineae bacterium]